ncbi:hypothetical protein CNYM01_10096 [Colletotrichum nymphaeae SA-01]|uniref:Heterokaryon incompatibility domain-containing protein n=1 Tax=Colletotrichum nymphaeae SA-01 TaxID=1460502 RepID=A0A135T9G2_9PEZI|nr:hypothetical protein CNYM01_10096 [Colletotrichum nymphaeae SA-01]
MTLINWHETCRKPDVEFSAGLGVPSCSSCGCIATSEGLAEAQHHQAPLVPAPTTRFELRWPLSLPFVDDPSVVSDLPEKTTAELKDVRGNVTPHVGQPTTSNHEPATNSSILIEAPYEPLFARKIRLLKLLKGNYNDPVRVELQVADLAIKPEYEALSYTWADENKDSSKCERVYIGDRWDILMVTKNCFNALRRLRYSYRSRKLWVDAICINQNDVGERSHQVGMMQSIYATAIRVLIYLGENPEDEDTTTSAPWNFDVWNSRSLPTDKDLTQEPYFKRVWIIQEIAAARDSWALYGTNGNRWSEFLRHVEAKQFPQAQSWFQMLPQGKLRDLHELPKILRATLQCQATDPRDKVYALLGLFQGAKQAQLIADYSLSLEQVFSGLTAFILCQSPEFMLPIFAALQPSTSSLSASWAINWSSASGLNRMEPYLPRAASQTYLPSELEHSPRFHRNGTLILRGRLSSQLSNCLFDPEARIYPHGVLKGGIYRMVETCSADSIPKWAKSTDEILQIRGLHDHALVLRPVATLPKTYRFVAIAKRPKAGCLAELINYFDCKVMLLFSAWQYVLKAASDGEPWFQTFTWDTIKAICCEMKLAGKRKADREYPSDLDLGGRLRDRVRSYNEIWKILSESNLNSTSDQIPTRWSTLGELQLRANRAFQGSVDIAQKFEEDPRVLSIFGWEYGAVPHRNKSGRREIPWKPSYLRDGLIQTFLEELSNICRYDYGQEVLDITSQETFAKTLLSQGLDQKIITCAAMEPNFEEVSHLQQKFQRSSVPWAYDFLNLEVERYPSYGVFDKAYQDTWAANFITSWTDLVNEKPLSSNPPSSNIAEEGHGSSNGIWSMENFTGAILDSRFTTPEVKPAPPDPASVVNWEPLLDLVRETEAWLLPLEEAFTRTDDTYDEDMKGVPWEDIRII